MLEPTVTSLPLLGFTELYDRLLTSISADSLPAALLFNGKARIGKTKFVEKLVQAIFCAESQPCGGCSNCLQITEKSHPELLWLDADSYKIEDAKTIREHLSIHPQGVDKEARVVVVIDFDRGNTQFQNQLLKTFEEPPPYAQIFLTTSKPLQILGTILSRVVKLPLSLPPPQEIASQLAKAFEPEHSKAAIEKLLASEGGKVGKVIRILQGLESAPDPTISQRVQEILTARSFASALKASQSLSKDYKITAVELTEILLKAINKEYRLQLGLTDTSPDSQKPVPWSRLKQMREDLARYRQIAVREKVPLNVQMIAESFAPQLKK